jgi:hypothetical protein
MSYAIWRQRRNTMPQTKTRIIFLFRLAMMLDHIASF